MTSLKMSNTAVLYWAPQCGLDAKAYNRYCPTEFSDVPDWDIVICVHNSLNDHVGILSIEGDFVAVLYFFLFLK